MTGNMHWALTLGDIFTWIGLHTLIFVALSAVAPWPIPRVNMSIKTACISWPLADLWPQASSGSLYWATRNYKGLISTGQIPSLSEADLGKSTTQLCCPRVKHLWGVSCTGFPWVPPSPGSWPLVPQRGHTFINTCLKAFLLFSHIPSPSLRFLGPHPR